MKVLMFGWEFPPHISGGLGTACFGLTQSLMKEKARVLFVVPRLFGDESKKRPFLINASLVTNGKETKTRATVKSGAGVIESSSGGTRREDITYLEVPAVLSPYESPGSKQQTKATVGLRSWNYSVTSEAPADPYAPTKDLNDVEMTEAEENGEALKFSGTYGTNLMEEVKHYAEVGGIIAKRYSFDVIHAHAWADLERDLSAWLGNEMQRDAFNCIMKLESEVKNLRNQRLLAYWRYLQTSDHFYYMSVKSDSDGSVHSYFSPFPSSYEAFINYMNVVTHFNHIINKEKAKPVQEDGHDLSSREAERQNVKTTTPVWVMNIESIPPANVPDAQD